MVRDWEKFLAKLRTVEFTDAAEVTIVSERRRRGPWGLRGGGDGAPGRNTLRRANGEVSVPGKARLQVGPGDLLTIETPGGGGWGRAADET